MALIRYNYPTRSPIALGFSRSPWSGLEGEINRLFEAALTGVNGSTGNQFLESSSEDGDAGGRSGAGQLVDGCGIGSRRDRQFRGAHCTRAGDRTQTEISPSP